MIFDKLLMTLGLTLLNGAVLNEPQRAITNTFEYEVINATEKNFTLEQGYSDVQYSFAPKTRNYYPSKVKTDDQFILYINKSDYPTKPTNFYYIYNAPDYEDPVTITFQDVPSNVWIAYINGYEPSTGIQIGQTESLIGKTLYFDNQELINLSTTNIVGQTQDINLLDGCSAKLYKENGTWTPTLTNITARITALPYGFMNLVQLIATINGQDKIIALNIDPKTINNTEYTTLPYMVFWDGFTNRLSFQSGYKTVKYGNLNGDYPYAFTPIESGYKGEQGEFTGEGDGWTALEAGMELVTKSFEVVGSFFNWVVFPGITLGLLLLFPILISMFIWMIKLIKKG